MFLRSQGQLPAGLASLGSILNVKRHGGHAVEKAGAMGLVECLVHAEILGGRKSTQKLVKAHRQKIPIITEEQFFKLAGIA